MDLSQLQSFDLNIAIGQYTFSLGVGEISRENYNQIKFINYYKRERLINGIFSAPNIGVIEVKAKTRGVVFPFHGLVDLKGHHEIKII
ncbi:MAG: hypothetical protein NTZ27_11800 [Ignavibacteriales bacterium]|nr:hypothetical protein [Ignavibacteriales bacterium]